MKKIFLVAAVALFAGLFTVTAAYAQYKYEFTTVKNNPATAVKNQANTGTCWCFATVSFLESEAIKKGTADTTLDLSEMYIVRCNYIRRLEDDYYRRGKGNTGPGGVGHQALWVMDHYGLMPESAYHGINYGMDHHDHSKLQFSLDSIMDVAVKEKKGMPYDQVNAILDKYLGAVPESFEYKGKTYTAQSFRDMLGLKGSDYVEITSFSHHPFYALSPLEIPDNFDHYLYYNVPLDDMVDIMDYAIKKGYTISWDSDMSETYFAHRNHIAVFAPGENIRAAKEIKAKYVEQPIDQNIRENMFMDYTTSDDHLMHITGIAKDKEGVQYFIVKNSWGKAPGYNEDGYDDASVNYVKAKTISILVNKNAVPKKLVNKALFEMLSNQLNVK